MGHPNHTPKRQAGPPPPPPSDQPRCPGLEILENCNPTCREQIRIGKCGGEGEVRSTVVKTPLVAYPSLPLCLRAYGYKTHGSTSLGPFRCCNAQTSGGPLGTPPPSPRSSCFVCTLPLYVAVRTCIFSFNLQALANWCTYSAVKLPFVDISPISTGWNCVTTKDGEWYSPFDVNRPCVSMTALRG